MAELQQAIKAKKARQLRELFKGRFNQREMKQVLKRFGYDSMLALHFLMTGEPAIVTEYLKQGQDINELREESRHLNEMLEAGHLWFETTKRQFACKKCVRRWWRKVPQRKQVSKCHSCRRRFEAIPRDKESGLGQFYCDGENCGLEFQGYAVMGVTMRMCPRCGYHVHADHIIPPESKKTTWQTHAKIHDTTKRQDGGIKSDPQAYWTRYKTTYFVSEDDKYRTWSDDHDSTGSTVTTFLTQ